MNAVRRFDVGPHQLEPGEWVLVPEFDTVYACCPNGTLANLKNHTVVIDGDTLTVTPSILCNQGKPGEWHGYITNGVWNPC